MTGENGENADELIGAALCNAEDDIILVSKLGMSLKFQPTTSSCARWAVRPQACRA